MFHDTVLRLDAALLDQFRRATRRARRSLTGAFREALQDFTGQARKINCRFLWLTNARAAKEHSKIHITLGSQLKEDWDWVAEQKAVTLEQVASDAIHRWLTKQPLQLEGADVVIPDSLREGGTAWLNTWSGKKVYPYDLKPAMVDIDDIARGLAHINRFAGQLSYTVAQHSVAVAMALEVLIPQNPVVWLQGLLHDASEAYLGDLPAPLKRTGAFPLYDLAEAQAQAAIFEALGIDEPNEAQSALIKQADLACLALEQRELWPQNRRHADWLEKVSATEGYVFRTPVPQAGFLGAFSRYSRILDEGGAG